MASDVYQSSFNLVKVLRAHILPLTNCAFNKSGDRFITGSYDRTCKVWDTHSGEEVHTLEGHKNVVYAIAFNNPFGDKIVTGSFDKTCKLWDADSGQLYYTLRGHSTEIVCLSFNPHSTVIATGSMDNTAKLWDVETGTERSTLTGHTAEIVSLSFNNDGPLPPPANALLIPLQATIPLSSFPCWQLPNSSNWEEPRSPEGGGPQTPVLRAQGPASAKPQAPDKGCIWERRMV